MTGRIADDVWHELMSRHWSTMTPQDAIDITQEAVRARAAETVAAERIAALEQHVTDLEKSLEQARKERDEFRAQVDAGVRIQVEVTGDATRMQRERDAALADNAALWRLADHAMAAHVGARDRPHLLEATKVLAAAHPGAALLERAKRLEAVLRDALVCELGWEDTEWGRDAAELVGRPRH